jgi:hypothetical protein
MNEKGYQGTDIVVGIAPREGQFTGVEHWKQGEEHGNQRVKWRCYVNYSRWIAG